MCADVSSLAFHLQFRHLLDRCCSFRHLDQIQGLLITSSLLRFPTLTSFLLRRATELGRMGYAERLFPVFSSLWHDAPPKVLLYNAMIRGYAYNGPHEVALDLFEEMLQREMKPNGFTYPYVVDSCTRLRDFGYGKKAHCQVIKGGFDAFASVAFPLLNFYIEVERSCLAVGSLVDAQRIFDGLAVKTLGLWNKMISACISFGDLDSARKLFDEMPERDVVSWNSMLSGHVKAADLMRAVNFFRRMPIKNVVSWTLMLTAFCNAGDLRAARKLFDEMPERNVVSWNSMLSGYMHHGDFRQACDLFFRMHSQGVAPDRFTFSTALSACAHLGDLRTGKWIHFNLIGDRLQLEAIVGTSLIEMYAKCSDIDSAFRVFLKMIEKDVFCWNVMIKAFAAHGRIADSLKLFEKMIKDGLQLNDLTFMSVLFACSNGGLVQEGRRIFGSMEKGFGIKPRIEHYGCLIDMLSRNGQLEEAQTMIKNMPYEPDIAVWGALLGGCRARNDIKLAEETIEKVEELGTQEGGVYVLLSNMYATSSQYDEATKARTKMEEKSVHKVAGCSSVLVASEL
ncbi:pentatricopeptide repeat-containing protein At1g09190-like [Curcuma longa]|uniref:pentatricopeptide repeat-containing protein At1g09190-like n=1 Tax=Curcuma longa TaxID=136217 RepID=UPI003D9E27B6